MAIIHLTVPEASCINCPYQIQRTDTHEDEHHCAIFGTRANGERPRICKEAEEEKKEDGPET